MDVCAKTLLIVEKMLADKKFEGMIDERYAKWNSSKSILENSLEANYEAVKSRNLNPQPVSGRQELIENIINEYLYS